VQRERDNRPLRLEDRLRLARAAAACARRRDCEQRQRQGGAPVNARIRFDLAPSI
jgi:hypothetical protein